MTFPIVAANGPAGYNLTRSLRFRSSASASLSRTMTTPTNNLKWTFSAWIKRGSVTAESAILNAGTAGSDDQLEFPAAGTIAFYVANGASYYLVTNAVYRDPAAWYHIVFVYDSANATASNRMLLYVNGSQVTSFSSAIYPTQNYASQINSAIANRLGIRSNSSAAFDGYMTEINFIDGQALTPSSFGSTNTLTGVWQPAPYTGTYGTNGFYLPFTDNSALTTSSNVGLGKDFSGNGNYWTTNNISITAGVTYDSMTDVPTLTSATAANFAVMNPVDQYLCSITQGNLSVTTNNGGYLGGVRSTIAVSSGKWYWETVITALGGSAGQAPISGIIPSTTPINAISSNTRYGYYGANGNKLSSAGSVSYGAAFSTGDVIGYALDLDAGTLTFYKNNASQGTAFTGLSGSFCAVVYDGGTGGTTAINFGQRPFSYTPPTGFVALNTYNLPTSTIVKGNTVMDATLYNGTGGSQSIVNAGGFKPDFVWTKARSQADQNNLMDSVRGVGNRLFSNLTNAETTGGLVSVNSNGFSIDSSSASMNNSGQTYVGWQWQAGQGTTSTNTNGTITSTVSVNASAGFSVVTYTGTGANATVGHGLGVAPQFIIVKSRTSGVEQWYIYHQALGNTKYLYFTTDAAYTINAWNNTSPTSSVFSLSSLNGVNQSANNFVAYCWTPIAGYSAFGSFVGNNSADGPFVYLGFRPKFIMRKGINTAGINWSIIDTSRNAYNVSASNLFPNLSDAESTPSGDIDITSNGFKVRSTSFNISGETYIYMAFAENPFKNALAR